MNVKKMFFSCLTILGIGTTQMLLSQSTIPQRDMWVIGNNIVKFDLNTGALLPGAFAQINPNPYTVQKGWQPDPNNFTISNSYHDESGNLLFYIADSKVYDWEGRFIGSLFYTLDVIQSPIDPTNLLPINGHNEIAIVPDKCNPSVFYIIAGERTGNGHSSSPDYRVYPMYTKLELGNNINEYTASGILNNMDNYGDQLADGRLGFANDYFNYQDHSITSFPYLGAPMHLLRVPSALQEQDEPLYSLAVSRVQADGNRLLFVSAGPEVDIFTNVDLATAGNIGQMSTPSPIYTSIQSGNQNPSVECELFQATTASAIRMANRFPTSNDYFYIDYTYASGTIMASSVTLLSNPVPTATNDYGLEFSPNGNYLYFTSDLGLAYFDLTQNTPTAISLASQVNISNFKTSQIEVGKDGALYFCNGPALGRLPNINNPTSLGTFATINLPNIVSASATIKDPIFQTLSSFVFSFNDQVDGEPAYPVIPIGSGFEEAKCCIERKKYDKIVHNLGNVIDPVYGAQNHNQVWSPGALNNPFGSISGVVTIKDRLIIPAGYTVTINNMTFEYKIFLNDPNNSTALAPFIDGAKCILERSLSNSVNGGVLILNNTTFKSISTCEGMWDGIEVQGDPNAVQQTITSAPFSIKSHQGKLVVNSGSIIQDAYFGATNYAFDLNTNNSFAHETYPLKSGGVIITQSASFKNNHMGVAFMPYSTTNVISRFKTTNFLVDAPLKNPLIKPFTMAFVFSNKTLTFNKCLFKNAIPSVYPIVDLINPWQNIHGIFGIDASISVMGGPSIGVPYGIGCTFENLGYGVRAINFNTNTILIQSSIFKNNWRGSYFGNYTSASVTKVQRNKYFVYEYPNNTPANDAAYGHYLDYCNNFIVQENKFYYNSYNESTGAAVTNTYNAYGCIVNEENPKQLCAVADKYQGDRIYKNLFKEIKFGAQAQGSNAERPKDLNSQTSCYLGLPNTEHNVGLKYVCNTFSGTDENDITVMMNGAINDPGRIAYQQGGGSELAGNVLSHLTGLCNTFNPANDRELYIDKTGITNTNPNYLQYTSNNSAAEQLYCFSPYADADPGATAIDLKNTGVISSPVSGISLCPSQIITLSSTGSVLVHKQLGKQIADLAQKLADGDADVLITLINTATNGQIKAALKDKSPYLSDRVLIAAIHKNLPDLTIREILMDNSPITQKVKQAMDASPISIGVKNQVNAQNGQSARAILEAQITQLKDEQHVYEIEALYAAQNDSLIQTTDSVINLIDYFGGEGKTQKKIKVHLSKNDLAKANQELNVLATDLGTNHPDYQYLNTIKEVYGTYNKGALGIINDATALTVIDATSQRTLEYDSKGALGIKEFFRLATNREWIQGKPNASSQRLGHTEDESTISVVENNNFKIYPNPSTGIFYYQVLSDELNDATLEVYDLTGKRIISGALSNNNTNGYIDLSNVTNGIYFVKVANNQKILFNTKLNVVK